MLVARYLYLPWFQGNFPPVLFLYRHFAILYSNDDRLLTWFNRSVYRILINANQFRIRASIVRFNHSSQIHFMAETGRLFLPKRCTNDRTVWDIVGDISSHVIQSAIIQISREYKPIRMSHWDIILDIMGYFDIYHEAAPLPSFELSWVPSAGGSSHLDASDGTCTE
ncbi:hypothetical protein BRD08_10025 [Halobacteriales archaeon SW_10_66_29]|nr:MAG: hypothetical protein BRD08_10025 [Halobacteriales archaeon SW_10_66_29]